MATSGDARHLTDGDVVRYLDGEGSEAVRERWRSHVSACPPCARAVETAREESATVSAWLARADAVRAGNGAGAPKWAAVVEAARRGTPPAGRMQSSHPIPGTRRPGVAPWLKAAAAILLVAGPLFALPPVRGWLAERVGSGTPAPEASAGEPETGPGAEGARIRFVPDPGRFTVTIEAPWRDGEIALERSQGDEAIFEIEGAAPDAVVSAAALRIRRGAGSVYFRLALPTSVREVLVIADGRRERVSAEELDAGRVVVAQPEP